MREPLSLAGLDLPLWFQAEAAARAETSSASGAKPHAKACIFLFMWGGPAQQDTWDMKPNAPVEYRGEFQPIATKIPGVQICEHLPQLAQRADKLAIIRSMTHGDVDHTTATHFPLTGRGVPRRALRCRTIGRASVPSWLDWVADAGRCRRSSR